MLRDGEIAVAISKERITRKKNAYGFYGVCVDYCLEAAGITMDQIDLVVRTSYAASPSKLEAYLRYAGTDRKLSKEERPIALGHPWYGPASEKVIDISHHLAHAYSAFAPSPFDDGAVMIVDGIGSQRSDVTEPDCENSNHQTDGDRETASFYVFNGTNIEPVQKQWGPYHGHVLGDVFIQLHGLGALYSRTSAYIFSHWNRCGEVMGLAPYGKESMEPLVWLENGQLTFREWGDDLKHPFPGGTDREWEDSPHMDHWKDVAWRIQHDVESVLVAQAKSLQESTGKRNLALAGGVALNCVANGRIATESGFDQVFIQPAAGDDGTAIGCAYYGHLAVLDGSRSSSQTHSFFGKSYRDDDIRRGLRTSLSAIASKTTPDDLELQTAKLLADGKVVGWFQGGAEFGPRALGHRSILADPRRAEMKEIVNASVKFRQGFRPFAPSILEERMEDWFEERLGSPFMILAQHVLPEVRDKIPAVVHVDGSVRAQTVNAVANPRYHKLLQAFEQETGVPILLNTSFNLRGEPIVETPSDAVQSFLKCGLDALVIGSDLYVKRNGLKWTAKFIRNGAKVSFKIASWSKKFA